MTPAVGTQMSMGSRVCVCAPVCVHVHAGVKEDLSTCLMGQKRTDQGISGLHLAQEKCLCAELGASSMAIDPSQP